MATVTYYVVQAFDEDAEGNLVARPAKATLSAAAARKMAIALEEEAAGVIAYSREADPDIGDYGTPVVLYQAGRVPDIE